MCTLGESPPAPQQDLRKSYLTPLWHRPVLPMLEKAFNKYYTLFQSLSQHQVQVHHQAVVCVRGLHSWLPVVLVLRMDCVPTISALGFLGMSMLRI